MVLLFGGYLMLKEALNGVKSGSLVTGLSKRAVILAAVLALGCRL